MFKLVFFKKNCSLKLNFMLVRNLESIHIRKVEYYILMYATMWTTRLNTLIIYLNHIYQLIIINHKYQIKLSISLLRSVCQRRNLTERKESKREHILCKMFRRLVTNQNREEVKNTCGSHQNFIPSITEWKTNGGNKFATQKS